jgi:hypothetical protein
LHDPADARRSASSSISSGSSGGSASRRGGGENGRRQRAIMVHTKLSLSVAQSGTVTARHRRGALRRFS